MAITYSAISTVTVTSSGTANIEFTAIPSTFTDLLIKVVGRTTRAGTDIDDELRVTFNNNTSGYTTGMLEGNGSSVRSVLDASGAFMGRGNLSADDSTADVFGTIEYYILDYTGANNKSISFDCNAENNAGFALMSLVTGQWANSAVITSIKLTPIGTFNANSTATLYGIKKF